MMVEISITDDVPMDELRALYRDPYIARVGHDHRMASPIDHERATYYAAYVDEEFAGAFLAIRQTQIELDVHALLKRRYIEFSREFGHGFISVCFEDPEIERLTAKVIDGLTGALNYCLKIGFTYEGAMRKACYQGGVAKDVHILGLLREEVMK